MKKIQINKIVRKDSQSIFTKQKKMHGVFLGNNVMAYFRDHKEAAAFLTATNRFLNIKLYELNTLYCDIFVEYRKAWFYFFNIADSRMQSIGVTGVFRELEIIEHKITFMVARGGYENGSTIVWHSFRIALESMQQISESLISMYKEKRFYNDAYQIRVILERVKALQDQLESWGKDMKKIDVYT
jgi:hypothetical protein